MSRAATLEDCPKCGGKGRIVGPHYRGGHHCPWCGGLGLVDNPPTVHRRRGIKRPTPARLKPLGQLEAPNESLLALRQRGRVMAGWLEDNYRWSRPWRERAAFSVNRMRRGSVKLWRAGSTHRAMVERYVLRAYLGRVRELKEKGRLR